MRLRMMLVAFLAACGGSQGLPPPPDYTPVNSPEPETGCPDQRDAAKLAREVLLEEGSPEARERAAARVFEHAECERAQLDAMSLDAPAQDAMIEKIRAARLQYQDARNLYAEVTNYEVLARTIGARSRLGDLHGSFADKLRAARPPAELTDPTERASFLQQLGDYAQAYDAEAVAAYRGALEAAELLPTLRGEPEVARWVDAACDGLDRRGATDRSMCE